jgi:5-oxoprolinase (ATP-hydrolysing) subunit A
VGSICVHGDTQGAAELAARVRAALEEAGASVRRFA